MVKRVYERVENAKLIAENLDYNERYCYYVRHVGEGVILTGEERALFDAMMKLYEQGRIILFQKVSYRYLETQKTEYLAVGVRKNA